MIDQPKFHLSAMRASVAVGTTFAAITRVSDQQIADNGTSFLSPEMASIRFAAAGGTNISRSRINTAAMREVSLPEIAPLNNALTIPSPANLADFGSVGVRPNRGDAVGVDAIHTDAGAQVMYALLWWSFGRWNPPGGKEYRVRFSSAITAVVGSWAGGSITFDQNLPGGKYVVTGMDIFGTNLLAARIVFPGGGYRPGVMARNAITGVPRPEFTNGSLGAFGEFDALAIPQIEVYAEAANTAQVGYLDLVKVL